MNKLSAGWGAAWLLIWTACAPAEAQSSFINSKGLWSTTANWSPAASVAGSNLVFGTAAVATNDFANLTAFGWVNISAAVTNRQSAGGNSYFLGNITNAFAGAPVLWNMNTVFTNPATTVYNLGNFWMAGAVSNTGTLTVDGTGALTNSGVVTGAGSLVKNGAGQWWLTGGNTYSGNTTINAGSLVITNNAGLGANPGALTASNIVFNGGTLVGAGGSTINLNVNRGIALGNGGGTLIASNGNNGQLQIQVPVSDLAGQSGLLTIGAGPGIVILYSNSTYSGGTLLQAGAQLMFANSAATGLLGTGLLTLNGGGMRPTGSAGTITLTNAVLFAADTTLLTAGAGTTDNAMIFTGPWTLTNGTRTLTAQSTNLVTLAGAIGDSGQTLGLIKAGAGALALLASNTYSGPTLLQYGTVLLGGTTNLDASSLVVQGAGAIGVTGAVDQTFLTWLDAKVQAGGTSVSGAVALAASGAQTLLFTNNLAPAFLGAALPSVFSGAAAWADNAIRLGGSGAALTYTPVIGSGTNLFIGPLNGNMSSVVVLTNALSTMDSVVLNSGTVRVGTNTLGTGLVTAQGGQLGVIGGGAALGNPLNLVSNLVLNTGGAVTLSGNITNAAGIGVTGGAVLTLTGSNTFDGPLVLTTGKVVAANNFALGSTNGGVTVAAMAGTSVQLMNGVTISGKALTLNGSGAPGALTTVDNSNTATGTWAGPITIGLNDTGGFNPRVGAQGSSSVLTISGPVSNGGGTNLYIDCAQATGLVILSGTNSYSGITGIIRGMLQMGATNAMPAGTILDLHPSSGTTVLSTFDLNGFNQTIGMLKNSTVPGSSLVTNTSLTPATLTVNQNGVSSFGGTLGGNLGLTKAGAGLLTLTGTNVFTGATVAQGGALFMTTNLAASAITVWGSGAIGPTGALDQTFLTWLDGNVAGGTVVTGLVAVGSSFGNAVVFTNTLAQAFLGAFGAAVNVSNNVSWADATLRLGGGTSNLVYMPAIGGGTNLIVGPVGGSTGSVVVVTNNLNTPAGTVVNSGTLQVGTNSLGTSLLTLQGGNLASLGAAALPNSINLVSNATITTTAGALTLAGSITNAGGLTVITTTSNPLILTGPNSYGGLTVVNSSGTLVLSNANGVAIPGNLQLGTGGASVYLRLLANEQIADSAVLSFTGQYGRVTLLGHTETLGGLNDPNSFGILENSDNVGLAPGQAGDTNAGPATLIISNAANYVAAGYVRNYGTSPGPSNTLALIKDGLGAQTLAGGQITYTGPTTVRNGALILSNTTSFASAVTVTGGQLQLSAPADINNQPLTNNAVNGLGFLNTNVFTLGGLNGTGSIVLTNNSGAPVTLTVGGNNTSGSYAGSLTGSGGLTKSGTGVETLSGSNSYSGVTLVNGGQLVLAGSEALSSASAAVISTNAGGLVLSDGIAITGRTVTIFMSGTANMGALQAAANATGTWAGPVVIGLTDSGQGWPRVGARAGGTLVISGPIQNGGGTNLYISGEGGTGRVILSGTNTYTGLTGVVRGILQLGADNALPTNTSLTLDSAAVTGDSSTFDLAGHSQTLAQLAANTSSSHPVLLTNSAAGASTLTLNQAANTAFPGNIGGQITLFKQGTGGLTLSGTNTQTGATVIQNGAILLTANYPSNLANSAVTVYAAGAIGPGGTVDQNFLAWLDGNVQGGTSVTGAVVLGASTGSSLLFTNNLAQAFLGAWGAAVNVTNAVAWGDNLLRLGGGNNTLNYLAPIGSGTNLVVGPAGNGAAGLVYLVNTANSYDGTLINSGTLQVTKNGTSGTTLGLGPVTNNGVLRFNNGSSTTNSSGLISGSGSVVLASYPVYFTNANTYSGGTLLTSGNATVVAGDDNALGTGPIIFAANGSALSAWFSAPRTLGNALIVSNNITLCGVTTQNGPLTLNGGVDLGGAARALTIQSVVTLNGVVTNGGLVKAGNSNLVLAAANAYAGDTVIAAGTLTLSNALALQSSTLNFTNGAVQFGSGLTSFTLGGLAGTQDLGLTNQAGAALTALTVGGNTSNTLYSGVLSQGGQLIKIGGGALTLAGNNAYAGATIISNGTLIAGTSMALPSATQLYADTLGALDLNGFSQQVGGLDGFRGRVLDTAGGGSLVLNFSSGTNVFSGALLGGSGTSFTLTGGGTLNLTGTNSFGGGTLVSNAVYLVNGLHNGGVITVLSNGVVGGSGALGTLLVGGGGIYAPGNSIATQLVASLTLTNAGLLALELGNNASDKVVVTNSLTISGGQLQLNLAAYTFNPGAKLTVVEWTGATGFTPTDPAEWFTLSDLSGPNDGVVWTNGATLAVNGGSGSNNLFTINYDDLANGVGGTQAVTLTAVPEPGTTTLLGLVGAALLLRRWRQRSPIRR